MSHLSRRRFMVNSAAAFAAGALAGCRSSDTRAARHEAAAKPNIVFIIVDDMGWADLGCYGQDAYPTPRLDRMAAEGARFTDAYSGCTVCAPARSCLMTGTHMGHTSVRGNTGGVSLEAHDVTVAQVLKEQGYTCGGFGKWGLGDLDTPGVPERHGFDEFVGYYHQIHAHYYYPQYLIDTGKRVPLPGNTDFYNHYKGMGGRPAKRDGLEHQFSHNIAFDRMKQFIRRNRDRPFFCYAPWTIPHGRYELPADNPAWQAVKDTSWPDKAKVHAAFTIMADRHVGEVLDLLNELGLETKTIVFFCSDNGADFRFDKSLDSSGPLRGCKRSMYEGGIRVPLIVRWPKHVRPGSVSDLPTYFPDVMPTLCDLAGARCPAGTDGLSILPTLLGEDAVGRPQQRHDVMYWEWHQFDWRKQQFVANGLMQALRMGKWKAVRHKADAPLELYDLSTDLGETHNLATAQPEVMKQVRHHLEACRTKPRPQTEPSGADGKPYR